MTANGFGRQFGNCRLLILHNVNFDRFNIDNFFNNDVIMSTLVTNLNSSTSQKIVNLVTTADGYVHADTTRLDTVSQFLAFRQEFVKPGSRIGLGQLCGAQERSSGPLVISDVRLLLMMCLSKLSNVRRAVDSDTYELFDCSRQPASATLTHCRALGCLRYVKSCKRQACLVMGLQ